MIKLKGAGVSAGYGIGRAVVVRQADLDYSARAFTTADEEKARLADAAGRYRTETRALADRLKEEAGGKNAEILEGHLAMLDDPFMLGQMNENIDGGQTAEAAVDAVCTMFYQMFASADDALLRQRATDVNDIKTSLLQLLLGVKTVDLAAVEPGSVLVAADFTPSMTSAMNRKNTVAMVAETGGVTSHSAILARAFEMPAVLSAAGACTQIHDGDLVIADGFSGDLFIAPDEETVEAYRQKQAEYSKEKALLDVYRTRPTVTKSGVHRSVYANIGSPAEAQVALESSAEGIGLFRTEFLFMDRPSLPDEEEQYKAYAEVAEAMAGKEVIIRTLDVGGDKDIPYLQMEKEENPFLGCRAIRYCLMHPEVFKVQLRALLRAACCGRIKIMLPMICTAEEIRQARALIAACAGELAAEGKPFRRDVPVGIMVETPAAALTSDLLAKEADFFSIGTNDLTGYVTACDRGNADVAYLYDAMQPAVQRAIQMTIENARRAGIPVGMCGEAAADQRLIPQLNAWGLDEFSVSPSSVLSTRKCICACD